MHEAVYVTVCVCVVVFVVGNAAEFFFFLKQNGFPTCSNQSSANFESYSS